MRRWQQYAAATAILTAMFASPVHASTPHPTGIPDRSFATDGKVPYAIWQAARLAATASGSLYAASEPTNSTPSTTGSVLLQRYTPQGNPDRNFSGDGKTSISLNHNGQTRVDALQPVGGALLAAINQCDHHTCTNAIARVNYHGGLDTTFGMGGYSTLPLTPSQLAFVDDIHVLSDGRIALAVDVAGFGAPVNYPHQSWLVRLLPNGRPDRSLSTTGWKAIGTTLPPSVEAKLTFSPNGRLYRLRAGTRLTKYRADGSPDPAFGTAGALGLHCSFVGVRTSAMVIDAAGRAVVWCVENATQDTVFVRFTSAGEIDTTFSGDGRLRSASGAHEFETIVVVADSANRLVMLGPEEAPASGWILQVRRVNSFGSVDATFGAAGIGRMLFFAVSDLVAATTIAGPHRIFTTLSPNEIPVGKLLVIAA